MIAKPNFDTRRSDAAALLLTEAARTRRTLQRMLDDSAEMLQRAKFLIALLRTRLQRPDLGVAGPE